jgi:hypothetical protein
LPGEVVAGQSNRYPFCKCDEEFVQMQPENQPA